jgi:hypothetical protein
LVPAGLKRPARLAASAYGWRDAGESGLTSIVVVPVFVVVVVLLFVAVVAHGVEVVALPPAGDPFADRGPLLVGSPEVETGPNPRVDDLLGRLREARIAPRQAGEVNLASKGPPTYGAR